MSTVQIPKWNIKADYVETCNCDYGCPCNFNGFPTYGFCRALVLYHIKNGSYGNTKLDGIDVIYAASWPKAIHEGNGTMQLFIGKKATEDQRKAIVNIFSGKAKGEGSFAIFANTFKYMLEPQFVDISAKIDGKKSSFSVPGIIDVRIESFKNPVTGEEQDTRIQLPNGFIWKVAEAAKSKMMRILTPNLNFDESGKNAFFSVVEYKGP
ncbi:hypothetical protein Ngar_c13360 [Candidatus Nitrososphaera gargensis Ga9.2]|uniref:DUF1326 domain-containing protein n=1 Tax=Nitrososphaera gargensis (strain Ga9.2) TaxID=1237085 RepID=K0IMV3_NITGG|nr:DUF1326 domain-containing protein [Candidatus Nitrososphaera gargensis]AFU58274.1 hypothetical protein Ngar_c13360 [Candidatus Nitrososphaera gargensis Ga9.2]